MELKNPVAIIRYIIATGSLLVMFFNLYDCILGNKTIIHYLLSVMFFLLVFLSMVLIKGHIPVVIVLVVTSILTMILEKNLDNISYAAIFFVLSTFIERDLRLRILIYFITLVICLCLTVFYNQTSADFINFLIGYIIVYSLSELVYMIIVNRVRREI